MVTEMCNPISHNKFHHIIRDELAMQKVCARWVPHLLSDEHMHQWIAATIEFLTLYDREVEAFIQRIITADET